MGLSDSDTRMVSIRQIKHAFYDYIDKLENILIHRFPYIAIEKEVGIKLKLSMTNVVFSHPCPLFSK